MQNLKKKKQIIFILLCSDWSNLAKVNKSGDVGVRSRKLRMGSYHSPSEVFVHFGTIPIRELSCPLNVFVILLKPLTWVSRHYKILQGFSIFRSIPRHSLSHFLAYPAEIIYYLVLFYLQSRFDIKQNVAVAMVVRYWGWKNSN